ncbi:MAG: LysR family transcriptional regulator [Pseudomonadota bacterium]
MIDWKDIPSLAALRGFEAAARCGSLSGAARELNVTHAAIAAHVRSLEAFFGTSLLVRAGQGMDPTPDGALLARGLGEGFGTILATCQDLRDRGRARPLSVTTTPTFAEYWLMPRISAFWANHPDINVTINPSPEISDLARDGHDLAIRFGNGDWPNLTVEHLVGSDFCIVASPSIAKRLEGADKATLLRQYWLMDHTQVERRYLAQAYGVDPSELEVRIFATNGMVLSAIRAGLGIGLQGRSMVTNDVNLGTLRIVKDLPFEGVGYHVVTRTGARSEALDLFVRWLKKAV